MRRRGSWQFGLAILAVALSTATLASQAGRGRGATQPQARGQTRPPDLPTGPDYTKFANGLYIRRLSQIAGPSNDYTVEEWSLLVGPGKRTDSVTLPGAAVLVVRIGSPELTIAGQRQDAKLGSSVLVPENQALIIVNPDKERAVSIRAVIVKGR